MSDDYFKQVIDPGDRASKYAKEIGFRSHRNNKALHIVPHQPGNFRGSVGYLWRHHIYKMLSDYELAIADSIVSVKRHTMTESVENDGAGGKPQFFSLVGTPEVFAGLGWEIITMTADDMARTGRFPAIIANEVNVKRISEQNYPIFQAMMDGYGKALKQSNLVNITGETAIMKNSVTAFCDDSSDDQLILNWGGTCIGLQHNLLYVDGSNIQSGMAIIGFLEPGYRCNGGTFFTNLIMNKWGPDVRDILQSDDAREFAKALTVPSQSYARLITSLLGWENDGSINLSKCADIKGIAHITGGGVWSKFGELLPRGVGANLHVMPQPADVLLRGYEMSQDTSQPMTPYDAYSTLHGGCGMMLVCPASEADHIIRTAGSWGVTAQWVGETTDSEHSEITITSQFGRKQEISSKNRPE